MAKIQIEELRMYLSWYSVCLAYIKWFSFEHYIKQVWGHTLLSSTFGRWA